jgi:hypothetical protein
MNYLKKCRYCGEKFCGTATIYRTHFIGEEGIILNTKKTGTIHLNCYIKEQVKLNIQEYAGIDNTTTK